MVVEEAADVDAAADVGTKRIEIIEEGFDKFSFIQSVIAFH